MNKSILWMGSAVLFLAISSFLGNYVTAEPTERVVKITAKAFEYIPNEITLKKDEPVALELTSQDLFHGFSITEMGLRAELPPGKTARVQLTPDKTGSFAFHCDNFCGTGHENMTGVINVVE